ncbi:MAG: hypothetical protein WA667_13300 [Candidatus Nitrosopolaris sp.]
MITSPYSIGIPVVQFDLRDDEPVYFMHRINLMNNPRDAPMRKRFAFVTAIVFAVVIMITIPFNRFILPSRAVAQQQQINSNTSSSQSIKLLR